MATNDPVHDALFGMPKPVDQGGITNISLSLFLFFVLHFNDNWQVAYFYFLSYNIHNAADGPLKKAGSS